MQPKWIEEILSSYGTDQKVVQFLTQLHLDIAAVEDVTRQDGFQGSQARFGLEVVVD